MAKQMEKKQQKKPVRLNLMAAVKQGARVAAPVGVGAGMSLIGTSIARRLSATAAAAIDEGGIKGAVVQALAGALLSGIGLAVYAKLTSPAKAVTMAPYVVGGALGFPLVTAAASYVVDWAEEMIAKLTGGDTPAASTPAGAYADISRGLQGRLSPAGAYADIGRGLQGRLGAPAGAWGEDDGTYYGPGNTSAMRLAPAGSRRL